jgi:Na+/proline symporter
MSPIGILSCVTAYSLLLFLVVWLTSRKADSESFFVGNRSSRWYVVAYGMVGASLSGITFISVPGGVLNQDLSYMQVVFGYFVGYWVIAFVLLPLYYRMHLTSIYSYLGHRFGERSHKTGSFFFILSRVVGAAGRLYIVVEVLQRFVFDDMGIPFAVTTAVFIALILLFTYRGGVKTIVWTDTLQTTFMLLSLVFTIYLIGHEMKFSFGDMVDHVFTGKYSKIVHTNWKTALFFPKQFIGGLFIAVAMTGLDQEMMQKNISCRNVGESKKNMITFSFVMMFVTILFLMLGSLLYAYFDAGNVALPTNFDPATHEAKIITDQVFPFIALNKLGTLSAIFFIIGLISAAYPSADGALTALTSIFCLDFLKLKEKEMPEEEKKLIRYRVHFSFAALLLVVILGFKFYNADTALVNRILTLAGYTYGPLLGLFFFGILTKMNVKDKWVPVVCVISPVLCWIIDTNSASWFNGYVFSIEIIFINGLFTFLGLLILRRR